MVRSIDKIKMYYYGSGAFGNPVFPYYAPDDVVNLVESLDARIKELEDSKIALLEKEDTQIAKLVAENATLKSRIQELEEAQPKWISFYDKVPDLYQNILVNVPGANHENRMEPTRSIFWCPARADELKVGLLFYTHWMPSPNPPASEELEEQLCIAKKNK